MRKTLTALSIAAALFAGQAMADQATVDNLNAQGVPLTAEQTVVIANAEGQALVDAIAALVAAQPNMAAAIVTAAVAANPELADAIQQAAVKAAPGQARAISAAVSAAVEAAATPGALSGLGSIPESSMPSNDGSGGGSTKTASPN